MASYVDGFVLPISKENLPAYRRIARAAGKLWREHGALDYQEFVGEDLSPKGALVRFPKIAKCKPGETVLGSALPDCRTRTESLELNWGQPAGCRCCRRSPKGG